MLGLQFAHLRRPTKTRGFFLLTKTCPKRRMRTIQVSTHVEYLMDPYGSLWSFVPGKFVWVIQMIQAPHTAPTWSWRVLVPWSPSSHRLNAERIQTWTDQFTHFTHYQHVEHRLSTSWCGDPPASLGWASSDHAHRRDLMGRQQHFSLVEGSKSSPLSSGTL